MSGRFIILVDKADDVVFPIVQSDGPFDGCCEIFASREEAEKSAADSLVCRAYPYNIIDLDDLP